MSDLRKKYDRYPSISYDECRGVETFTGLTLIHGGKYDEREVPTKPLGYDERLEQKITTDYDFEYLDY